MTAFEDRDHGRADVLRIVVACRVAAGLMTSRRARDRMGSQEIEQVLVLVSFDLGPELTALGLELADLRRGGAREPGLGDLTAQGRQPRLQFSDLSHRRLSTSPLARAYDNAYL